MLFTYLQKKMQPYEPFRHVSMPFFKENDEINIQTNNKYLLTSTVQKQATNSYMLLLE